MRGLAVDTAAWSSRWRVRSVRDKTVLSLGLVAAALWLPAWPATCLVAGAAVLLAVVGAGTPLRLLGRAMRGPLVFVALGTASLAVTLEAGWTVHVDEQSLRRAAEVAAHAIAGSLALMLLAVTTPMVDLLAGLRRLGVPAACVEVAGLVYRMLFILLESLGGVRESQSARLGYASWTGSLRSAGALTAAVLTRSWDRASRWETGLAGREVAGALTTVPDPRPGSPVFLGLTCLGLAFLVATSVTLA